MSFHRFLLVLKARRAMVFAILGTMIFLVLLVSLILPKEYTATASVVVDAKTDPVAGMVYSEELLTGYIATQVDIISSERVLRQVIAAAKLDQRPELLKKWKSGWSSNGDLTSWLVVYLQKKLAVTPSRDSNVINIAVEWTDAQFAADLANTFANIYIETNIELRTAPAKQYATWFDRQAQTLRADLQAKQKRLSDHERETGVIASDEKLDIETARLSELSTQLGQIEQQRQESQSRQRQVYGDIQSMPEVLQSPVISDLKDDLTQAEARKSDIAARLGKNHPDYQAVEAEIAGLRGRITDESAKIANSLGTTTQVNVRRESDLRAALEAQKKRVLELKHGHDDLSVMESDVLTAQRDLDTVTQHRAQSNLESFAQQSNVVLLTSASAPLKPSGPKIIINALLGTFLGILLGIGAAIFLEVRDPRIRDAKALFELLNVPLLGQIGRITAQGSEKRATTKLLRRLAPSAT